MEVMLVAACGGHHALGWKKCLAIWKPIKPDLISYAFYGTSWKEADNE